MGGRRNRWGRDFSTEEEAGEGKEEALKCSVSLGNPPPKQAYLLHFPRPKPLSPLRLFPDNQRRSELCPPLSNLPHAPLPLLPSKA